MKKTNEIRRKIVITVVLFVMIFSAIMSINSKVNAEERLIPIGSKALVWSTKIRPQAGEHISVPAEFATFASRAYEYYYGDQLTVDSVLGINGNTTTRTTLPDLKDYCLVFVVLPYEMPTDEEIEVLRQYVARGGRLVFIGEYQGWSGTENTNLSQIASKLGAHFTIESGSYGNGYISERNPESRLYSLTVEQSHSAPITYTGEAQWVYKIPNQEGYNNPDGSHDVVWCVDEAAGNGKITVLSDTNWAVPGSRTDYPEQNAYEFMKLLLEDSIKNIEEVSTNTVTFETDGGTEIESQKVKNGEKVIRPENPTKEGYTFEGWYIDEEFEEVFDFNTLIYEDRTLYAKWTKIEEDEKEEEPLQEEQQEEKEEDKSVAPGKIPQTGESIFKNSFVLISFLIIAILTFKRYKKLKI